VLGAGVEPAYLSAPEPKSGVSAIPPPEMGVNSSSVQHLDITRASRRRSVRSLVPLRQSPRLSRLRPDKSWAVYYPDSKNSYRQNQGRRFFRNKSEAEAFCDIKRSEIASLGAIADSLTDDLKRDAVTCFEMLKPLGCSLVEAVTWFVKDYDRRVKSVMVSKAIDSVRQRMLADGNSRKHCNNLTQIAGSFAKSYGDELVSSIRSSEVQAWLDDYRTKEGRRLGAVTFNSYRRYLSLFFSFCIKRGWLTTNPLAVISPQKVFNKAPRLLSPSELKAILEASPDELRLPIALQAFCGLRASEVSRVLWSDVLIGESGNYIQIGASNAKTMRRRLSPIPDNLMPLILKLRKLDGFVYADGKGSVDAFQKALVGFRKSLKSIQWGRNALRASALSYRLALTKDAAATALEMGNSPSVLMRDYRELTTPAVSRDWISISVTKN